MDSAKNKAREIAKRIINPKDWRFEPTVVRITSHLEAYAADCVAKVLEEEKASLQKKGLTYKICDHCGIEMVIK